MSAIELTGANLIRALGNIAGRPAIARAMREKAEGLAEALEEQSGAETRIAQHNNGDVVVEAAAPGLFAREFGSVAAPARPVVAAAIAWPRQGGAP